MTMQTLIAVCDSLWLDSTTNMLSQIVIYSFLVLSIFYLKNCHQGVLWLIYCMLFPPLPCFLVLQQTDLGGDNTHAMFLL